MDVVKGGNMEEYHYYTNRQAKVCQQINHVHL